MNRAILAKLSVSAVLFGAWSGIANAADLAYKAPLPAIYDWTGFYIGGHVGWEGAKTDGFTTTSGPLLDLLEFSPTSQTMKGWLGGAQLGYNYQFRRAVVGFEVSGSWTDLKNQTTSSIPAIAGGGVSLVPLGCASHVTVGQVLGQNYTSSCTAEQDWTVNALTRLGYTFGEGRFLPYVTGGVAITHLRVATTNSVAVVGIPGTSQATFGASRELAGVVLGAGAQYALGNGFSIGVEYLYTKYPTEDFSSLSVCSVTSVVNRCGALPVSSNQQSQDLATNTIRAVLNYKLGDL